MQAFTTFMNLLWTTLSVVAQILSVAVLISLFVKKNPPFLERIKNFVSKRAILIAFIASLCATLGSLVYSEVIGYDPCKLCWFQRIFLYPIAVLTGIALWKNDMSVRIYALVLSILGGLTALFHYVGQLGWNPFGLECLVVGYSSSCAKNFVLQFGYITIPLMAFSAAAIIAISLYASIRSERKDS